MPMLRRRWMTLPLAAGSSLLALLARPREAAAAALGSTMAQPSFETAGLIVMVSGDSGNEAVTVEIKGPGDADFRPAHAAVSFEPHAFATSLFGLSPGTDYQVRVTLADPDGVSGDASQVVNLHTRAEPTLPAPSRVRWVGPGGQDADGAGTSKDSPFLTPGYALAHAAPGDEIRVLAGTYGPISTDGLHATEEAPVVLRADDPAARPLIDGGQSGNALAVNDASWLVIDGFEVTSGGADDSGHGVYLRASSHVAVRHCFIHDNGHDDVLISKGAEFSGGPLLGGFHLIEDNDIADTDHESCDGGSNTACPKQTYYGIKQDNNPGGGTVIRRNRVRGHDDNTSPCGDEDQGRHLAEGQPVLALVGGGGAWTNHDLEIYDNSFEDARDDGMELDGICVNARIYRNRVVGAQNAFSAAPALPGPYFFVRNVATGPIVEAFFKLNTAGDSNVATRHIFVYHNDFVRTTPGTLLNVWFAVEGDHNVPIHDVVFRNNVFSAPAGGTCINSYNHGTEEPSFDGDVWFSTDNQKLFSWWNGASNDTYDSFAAWQAGAMIETHGTFGDPGLDTMMQPAPGSIVVDHAVPLPGINDLFTGSAPDVGAFELGAAGQGGSAGSGQAGSGQAGSGQAGSGQGGSGTAGSGQAGSGQAGKGNGSSGQAGSGPSAGGQAGQGNAGSSQAGHAGSGGSGNAPGGAGKGGTNAAGSAGKAGSAGGVGGAADAASGATDSGDSGGCSLTPGTPRASAPRSLLALLGMTFVALLRRGKRRAD